MNMDMKNKKSTWVIAAVLIVGLVLGIAILRMDRPAGRRGHGPRRSRSRQDDHDLDHMGARGMTKPAPASTAPAKGPHGGPCSPRAALAWN